MRYEIQPGSPLDVPKHLLVGVGDFETRFTKHLESEAQERDVMVALAYAYKEYERNGAIRFVSPQRQLGRPHQEAVQKFFERELANIAKLYQFAKSHM